ncbi:MAG: fumarylacetoacetate hydrolase family protein [Candidatus Bathyarchaeia archaeon]
MKVVRFLRSDSESYGLLADKEIISLPLLAEAQKRSIPSSLESLISLGAEGIQGIEELIHSSTKAEKKKATLKMDEVSILAPIASPPKIVCLGLNYRDHAEEQGATIPEEPVIFMKPRTAIIGPEESIVKPSFVRQLDYEAELAVVVGKRGKNIPVSEAKEFIFGYMAFNDVSARDIQFRDRQWTRGKSFDTFAPMGPCVTTTNQIGDPNNLSISTRVNGEERQNSSTRNMVFNVYEIVHQISRVMTLEPCDVIATGTPAGVAVFMKPEPKFLSPGDVVEVEIENIGKLRNKVVENKLQVNR